jgi:hypothetical protein
VYELQKLRAALARREGGRGDSARQSASCAGPPLAQIIERRSIIRVSSADASLTCGAVV